MTIEPIRVLGWTPGAQALFQSNIESLVSRFAV